MPGDEPFVEGLAPIPGTRSARQRRASDEYAKYRQWLHDIAPTVVLSGTTTTRYSTPTTWVEHQTWDEDAYLLGLFKVTARHCSQDVLHVVYTVTETNEWTTADGKKHRDVKVYQKHDTYDFNEQCTGTILGFLATLDATLGYNSNTGPYIGIGPYQIDVDDPTRPVGAPEPTIVDWSQMGKANPSDDKDPVAEPELDNNQKPMSGADADPKIEGKSLARFSVSLPQVAMTPETMFDSMEPPIPQSLNRQLIGEEGPTTMMSRSQLDTWVTAFDSYLSGQARDYLNELLKRMRPSDYVYMIVERGSGSRGVVYTD